MYADQSGVGMISIRQAASKLGINYSTIYRKYRGWSGGDSKDRIL